MNLFELWQKFCNGGFHQTINQLLCSFLILILVVILMMIAVVMILMMKKDGENLKKCQYLGRTLLSCLQAHETHL